MRHLVIDTNVILLDANNIIALGASGDVVCIPETVIDEVDSKKSGLNELAYQARSFGRLITNATQLGRASIASMEITKFDVQGSEVWIVSSSEYPNFDRVADNILNDRKIMEIAIQLNDIRPDVEFMSIDVMCRIRAESLGLVVRDFKVVDKVDYEFTKLLAVPDNTFRNLHGKRISDIDSTYEREHYNYKFSSPDSSQVKLASISNGIINILGKDSEADMRRQDVNPSNSDQLLLSRAIQDPTMDLIVCEALAGSGKTLVSLSNAMRLVKTNSPYDGILYVRASINDVEDIEEVGFLKGSAEEKNSIYFHPLYDSLDFIARNRFKGGKLKSKELEEKVQTQIVKMEEEYNIEALTGLGMRGRTFTGKVIIIDEVQGMSKASLQKVLTRFGKNCKVILVGSNNQIDNPNMTKFTNGLSVILNNCATEDSLINRHVVPLQKVVRSDFAEYAEKLFSKE